ncbi:MAG: PDZ domain-containing protein [Armatimonadota bacterium]|nr:PDZ domain-containing protein [Armatimonadota bacterium]
MLLALVLVIGQSGSPSVDVQKTDANLANLRQLTFGGQNAEAYWNSAGNKLIFQSTQPEWPDEQILTMFVDGSGRKLISSGKGRNTCGYFLPNGDVVFSATDWKDKGAAPKPDMSKGYVWRLNPYFAIFRAKPDGTERRKLLGGDGHYYAETTVSPDGKYMVFTSTRDGDVDIYRSDLEGKNVKRLTDALGYDGGGFVSWDSKRIVYRRDRIKSDQETKDFKSLLAQNLVRPSKLEVWVMDADGTNKIQVTDLGAASFAPFMHPDGKRIIFSSNYGDPKGREFDLFIIDIDGKNLKRITSTPEFDGFPMFTKDGKRLVWASNRNAKKAGETNVFVADWLEDGERPVTPEAGGNPAGARRVRVGLIPAFGEEAGGGLLLDGVQPNSPAEKGGLKAGDRIVEWGGRKIDSIDDIQAIFEESEPGQPVKVVVLRGADRVELTVTPEKIG